MLAVNYSPCSLYNTISTGLQTSRPSTPRRPLTCLKKRKILYFQYSVLYPISLFDQRDSCIKLLSPRYLNVSLVMFFVAFNSVVLSKTVVPFYTYILLRNPSDQTVISSGIFFTVLKIQFACFRSD